MSHGTGISNWLAPGTWGIATAVSGLALESVPLALFFGAATMFSLHGAIEEHSYRRDITSQESDIPTPPPSEPPAP